jgi:hypothetical protein
VMWFYNKLVIDFLSERKEMIEALRAERKEWLTQSSVYLGQLFETHRSNAQALTEVRGEMHNLRNKIHELLIEKGKGSQKSE